MAKRLSKRLQAVADFVPENARLVDIGTDHAHLPIALLQEGRIKSAIAMDVVEGPLARARQNVKQCDASVQNRIVLRLSDGFCALQTNEADCAVLAGMGGDLMIRILAAKDVKALGLKTLVLEPQSEAQAVRRYLREHDLFLNDEAMVTEANKFYPVLQVVCEGTHTLYDTARNALLQAQVPEAFVEEVLFRFGPSLLLKKDGILSAFLLKEQARLDGIIKEMGQLKQTDEMQESAVLLDRTMLTHAISYLTGGEDEV